MASTVVTPVADVIEITKVASTSVGVSIVPAGPFIAMVVVDIV